MGDFRFGYCSECSFSIVVEAAVLVGGAEVVCPQCEALGRMRLLVFRPALATDTPADLDMRTKGSPPIYTCCKCGRRSSHNDEAAAQREFEAMHGRPPTPRDEPICDDCFRKLFH